MRGSVIGRVAAALLVGVGAVGALLAAGVERLGDGRDFVHARLENGLEVSIVADPRLELVATQVWYHVGSADEDEGSRGLAHLFEHLMFGPTERFEKDAVFHWHHRHGGDNNAYTSFDETVYVSEIAPPHHLRVLDLEAARMNGLRVGAEELANEQRIVTEELRLSTENDPFTRVMVRALDLALAGHPYAWTPVGTKEDIAAASVESCEGFYSRFYHASNAHVVVVGPVDPLETLAAVEQAFGELPARSTARREIPELTGIEPRDLVLSEELPPVETAILFFALPPADHEDAAALAVLQKMLFGRSDPFRDDLVRKRKNALEAGVEVLLNRRGGALGFYAAHLPYRRKETAFRQIRRTLARLETELDASRLRAARREIAQEDSARRFRAQTMARGLGIARWHQGDAREAWRRRGRLEAVTLEDVHRVWRRYVVEAESLRMYVKPERVPLWIRMFGWLYPVVA